MSIPLYLRTPGTRRLLTATLSIVRIRRRLPMLRSLTMRDETDESVEPSMA